MLFFTVSWMTLLITSGIPYWWSAAAGDLRARSRTGDATAPALDGTAAAKRAARAVRCAARRAGRGPGPGSYRCPRQRRAGSTRVRFVQELKDKEIPTRWSRDVIPLVTVSQTPVQTSRGGEQSAMLPQSFRNPMND